MKKNKTMKKNIEKAKQEKKALLFERKLKKRRKPPGQQLKPQIPLRKR
jgi:hypothetical protein